MEKKFEKEMRLNAINDTQVYTFGRKKTPKDETWMTQ